MAIGDDLFTMLGLIPARDRAGIARGTMADEAKASMAANGNAEGRALLDGGARPPAFALPPQMKSDIQLPDDVPTAYAAGKGNNSNGPSIIPQVLPPSQDRVVASSPAAAPSPAVTRNSDIILQAIQKQAQQQRMMQIISGIGQMVSGATGHSGGGVSAGGGGGGGDISTLKGLLEMRDQETDRERIIDHAKRELKLSDADARALHAQGKLAGFNDPEYRLKLEDRGRVQKTRDMLLGDAAGNAAAVGMPEHAWRTLVENNPTGAAELLTPDKLEAARTKTLANKDTMSGQEARMAEVERLRKAGAPAEDIIAAWDPEAAKAGFKKRSEMGAEGGHGTAVAQRDKFLTEEQKPALSARTYLEGPGRDLGDMWNDKIITGTFEDLRRTALWRPLATLTGKSDADLNTTAKIDSALKQYVITNAKALGPNPSNRDAEIFEKAGGNVALEPHELRGVISMNERIERRKIQLANERRLELLQSGKMTEREFREIPPIPMPEPTKIIKDDIYAKGNEKLRTDMARATQQLKAAQGTPQEEAAIKAFNNMSRIFNREFGAETHNWFINKEKL